NESPGAKLGGVRTGACVSSAVGTAGGISRRYVNYHDSGCWEVQNERTPARVFPRAGYVSLPKKGGDGRLVSETRAFLSSPGGPHHDKSGIGLNRHAQLRTGRGLVRSVRVKCGTRILGPAAHVRVRANVWP